MQPQSFHPLDKAGHARVVDDNYYFIRFQRGLPNIHITDLQNLFAARINSIYGGPHIQGAHYVVDHSHANQVTAATNLSSLLNQVILDITFLSNKLNSIPSKHEKAQYVLAKEIANDQLFKTHIEQTLLQHRLHGFQTPPLYTPETLYSPEPLPPLFGPSNPS